MVVLGTLHGVPRGFRGSQVDRHFRRGGYLVVLGLFMGYLEVSRVFQGILGAFPDVPRTFIGFLRAFQRGTWSSKKYFMEVSGVFMGDSGRFRGCKGDSEGSLGRLRCFRVFMGV